MDELSKIATCYGFINNHRIVKEINKKELEQNFRKRIELIMLISCIMNGKIISDEQIDIYEKVNVSELVTALSNRNCIVNDFQKKEESLESYYLNLIGGSNNV